MKRFLTLVFILSIPVFVFVSVYQYYAYTALQDEVVRLEEVQEEKFEKNKRTVAGIAVFNSPQRIVKLAREVLGLLPIEPGKTIQIRIPQQRSNQDG